jgi:hypothetical protein
MTVPPDRWPQTAKLIPIAFHDDTDIATMAAQELLDRLPSLPAIPLALEDGRRKVIRRTEAP